jgi:acetyl-CoA C-acetyltransferase
LQACPFGGSNNFPRSVGNRIGANPSSAVYDVAGGQSPQKLVGEFFEKLNAGECDMVLLAGGEAMANIKVASKNKVQLDWREEVAGQLEDRGIFDGSHMITRIEIEHKLMQPVQFNGLMEQARRGEKDLDADAYNQKMANCFSKLSRVAAGNPYAMNTKSYEAEELITVTDNNRMVCSPYPKNLVAKDGVNQGAALLLTTVGKAKELGIAEEMWTCLHGYAETRKKLDVPEPWSSHLKAGWKRRVKQVPTSITSIYTAVSLLWSRRPVRSWVLKKMIPGPSPKREASPTSVVREIITLCAALHRW